MALLIIGLFVMAAVALIGYTLITIIYEDRLEGRDPTQKARASKHS